MTGELVCRSTPSGATVYYNGTKLTNPTPVRLIKLSPGLKTLGYSLPGYHSYSDRVEVFDDTTSYSNAVLKAIDEPAPSTELGKIRCVTTPPGAVVHFNGRKQINVTPVTLTGVTPNKSHTIKYTKSDFLDASDQWLVKPGQTIVAEKILIPVMQPGYINAISDLPGVTVKMIIEGKTYSYQAPHKFGAPAGRNVVFFSKPDHKQVEHSVTVEPRQTVTIKGNPIPIVADTVLILNTLPSEVSEGDKITLTGTLTSKDGKPVVGQIHFYDKDTATADDELFEKDKPLVAMSSSSTGKYSATWTVKKVDSESLIKRGTSGAQIYAAFDGTQTHNKSKSTIRNITLKEIVKEGQLRITTRPPGADVYIDDEKQPIGTSAEEFSVIKKLPFGKYTVKTEIKGFDPMEEEVEIKEGPYETIVNHIYEGAKNLCGVLGLETTELGCVRAILTLPIDFFTPLADAYVIKEHKSMYTGKPETPTKLTYAAFALGCIPFIGGPATSVGKTGFKLFSNGIEFIKVGRTNADLLNLLADNLFFNRITSMTSVDITKALKLATDNKLDELEHFIQTFKIAAIPESAMKEWTDNMLKLVDADDIAELKSILKIDVLAAAKIGDIKTMFREFLAGTRILADADFVKLLNQFADSPDDFWELMRILPEAEFDAVIKKVDGLSISDPIGISYFLREAQTKVNTLAALPEFKPRTNKVYRAAAEPNFKQAVSDLAKLTLKDLDLPGKLTPADVDFMKKFADYTHDALYYIDFDNAAKFSSDTFKTLIASTTKTKPPIINSAVNSNAATTLSKIATDATETSNFLKDTPKTKLNEVSSKIDFTPYSDLLGDLFAWAKPFDDLPDTIFKPVTQNSASITESLTKFSNDAIPDASTLIANYMDITNSIRKMKWESPTKMVRSVADDLPSISSLETTASLSKTLKAAPSNMPGLRFVIDSETSKLIDTAAIFTKQLPEGSKYIFPVDPSDAENARKIFKTTEMATDFLKKYDSIFTDIRADKFDTLTRDAMDKFIEMLIKDPDAVIPLINKVYETRSTIYHLRPLDDPFIVNFRLVLQIAEDLRLYLGTTPAKFADSMSELGKTAKAIRAKTSKEILESSNLTFDLIESIRRGEGLIAHKFIDILPAFLRNVAKGDVSLVANIRIALKTLLTAILKDAKKSPFFAYWIVFDTIALITFVSWLYLKSTGDEPGTHRFTVNEKSKQLETIAYLIRDVCKTDVTKSSEYISKYEDTLNSLIEYTELHRSELTKSEYITVAEDAINIGQISLEKFKDECLPAEIPIPESGLLTNVTVKEIIDGDTIECFKDNETFNVRMAGYNTPEKKPAILDFYPVTCTESVGSTPHTIECSKEMYQEANGFFWKLIESKTVSLKINPDRSKDAYGRYIAVVILENGSEANLEMIKAGHACFYHEEYFGEPIIYDPDTYIAARDEAKAAGLGIWASEELEADVGTVYLKAYRYTEEEKLTPKSVEVWLAATEETAESFICMSSPDEVILPIGDYDVVFRSMGFEDQPKSFTLEKDETLVIEVTMKEVGEEEQKEAEEEEGYLLIKSYRISSEGNYVYAASDVFENDKYLFRTSESSSQAMPPGEHTIVLKRLNYENKTESFIIYTGENTVVNSTLVELEETEDPDTPEGPIGLVDFMTTPSVAKIFVDGLYIGTTKKSGFECVEGTYTVSFEKSGYDACIKSITVIADERVPVECILIESLLPPTEGEYPDVPYFPTSPSRTRLPPSTYEIAPMLAPPTAPEPEAEPWEEFKDPMKILFLNIGKEVAKQTTITTAGEKFIDKHCDLEFEWESEDHNAVELGTDDDDCATLDDTEELTEIMEQDKVPEGTKIVYLLWNADEPKCVSYTGFTSGMDDLLFDAMLCSSPTSKSKPEFTATTGKLKNDNLDIKYEGSLTIIIQICEALHELYEKTKSDDAEELPEFDDEFCKKDITDDRPNAKCVVEWLSKFNDALPDEVKK